MRIFFRSTSAILAEVEKSSPFKVIPVISKVPLTGGKGILHPFKGFFTGTLKRVCYLKGIAGEEAEVLSVL